MGRNKEERRRTRKLVALPTVGTGWGGECFIYIFWISMLSSLNFCELKIVYDESSEIIKWALLTSSEYSKFLFLWSCLREMGTQGTLMDYVKWVGHKTVKGSVILGKETKPCTGMNMLKVTQTFSWIQPNGEKHQHEKLCGLENEIHYHIYKHPKYETEWLELISSLHLGMLHTGRKHQE